MNERAQGRGWGMEEALAGLPLHPTSHRPKELEVEKRRGELTGTVLDFEENLGVRHDCG